MEEPPPFNYNTHTTTLEHEQQSPRALRKSFASVCKGETSSQDVKFREPTVYRNLPAVMFSADEIQSLSAPLKFALVGKLRRNPDLKTLRLAFQKLGLIGQFTIGALHPGFILINLSVEEDYNRMWTKQEWFLAGTSIRLFKWSPDFELEKESSIVPVWISLPHLPFHLFSKGALFSIANTIGQPLKLDEATANKIRPSVARICVEVDLRKQNPELIWINNGGSWIKQKVIYEGLPPYCVECWRRGHTKENCKSKEFAEKQKEKAVKGKSVGAEGEGSKTKQGLLLKTKGSEDLQWIPVINETRECNGNTMDAIELMENSGTDKGGKDKNHSNEPLENENRFLPLMEEEGILNSEGVNNETNEVEISVEAIQCIENKLLKSGSGLSLQGIVESSETDSNNSMDVGLNEMAGKNRKGKEVEEDLEEDLEVPLIKIAKGRPRGSKTKKKQIMSNSKSRNTRSQLVPPSNLFDD